MLNEAVKRVLKESMWDLATCVGNEPNVVPVAFKDVTEAGRLVVGDVFLETTLNNLKANGGRIAISVYDAKNLEGYQIKGTAEYVTEGEVVRTFKAMVEKMFQGAATAKAKGALLITPEQVIVTTLGQTIKRFWHKTKLQVKRCHGKRLFVIGKHLIAESRFTVYIPV